MAGLSSIQSSSLPSLALHFLHLPNEILDAVFSCIFGNMVFKFPHHQPFILVYDGSGNDLQREHTNTAQAVQLTCKDFYLRARRILYATNTFIFFEPEQLNRFLAPAFLHSHNLLTSLSAEVHLDDRKHEKPWDAAFNLALRSLPRLKRLCVYISIENMEFKDDFMMGAYVNHKPLLFASVPCRPPRLDDVSIVVIATDENWLAYAGIPPFHFFPTERKDALEKQAAWIEKVTARLLGFGS